MNATGVVSLALMLAVSVGLAGCGSDTSETTRSASTSSTEKTTAPEPAVPEPVELALQSSAFSNGQPIPARYTADGADVSPPLSWSGLPEGTKQLALICDDPDAPDPANPGDEPWVHWVIYKIPPDVTALPEGIPQEARPDVLPGAIQGRNDWPDGENVGYRGPAPPIGEHRYVFTLYALDAELDVQTGLDKPALLAAIAGRVLAKAELTGTYAR